MIGPRMMPWGDQKEKEKKEKKEEEAKNSKGGIGGREGRGEELELGKKEPNKLREAGPLTLEGTE